VVAVADNGVIGRGGTLPWHLPDDLKHFRAVTWGKPVLMGRRTFESIGKPLPGRRNLVLSRAGLKAAAGTGMGASAGAGTGAVTGGAAVGVERFTSFEEAVDAARDAAELCVIGGADVFALALPRATRVYLTRVHGSVPGDVFFPLSELSGWRELQRLEHAADERHAHAMSFLTLERFS
jgi:dihydrofolate reductase